MGVYGAYEYTKTDQFKVMSEEEANWNPIKPDIVPEPEEEVKVRVWFEDNNYFDDHFDLKKREHLIGKTLTKFAKCSLRPFLNNPDDKNALVIQKSLEVLGLALWEKWDQLITVVNDRDRGCPIAKECVEAVNNFASGAPESGDKEEAVTAIQTAKTAELEVSEYLKNAVNDAVSENESDIINHQITIYNDWMKERAQELDKQLERLEMSDKKKELADKKRELDTEEKTLFFFENYAAMEEDKNLKFKK